MLVGGILTLVNKSVVDPECGPRFTNNQCKFPLRVMSVARETEGVRRRVIDCMKGDLCVREVAI